MDKSFQKVKKQIIPALRAHSIKKAAVFGSFVRGEMKKNSDIDILIEFMGEKSLFDLINLKLNLEEILKRKVDILTYNSLHPFLKDIILNEQKIIYEKA